MMYRVQVQTCRMMLLGQVALRAFMWVHAVVLLQLGLLGGTQSTHASLCTAS